MIFTHCPFCFAKLTQDNSRATVWDFKCPNHNDISHYEVQFDTVQKRVSWFSVAFLIKDSPPTQMQAYLSSSKITIFIDELTPEFKNPNPSKPSSLSIPGSYLDFDWSELNNIKNQINMLVTFS